MALALLLAGCTGGGQRFDFDGDGWEDAQDCAAEDPDIFPRDDGDDVGDGIDQNCDGVDGLDLDRDGHASEASGGDDCRDDRPDIHPDADEVPDDGEDNDCDGVLLRCDADGDGSFNDHPLCGGTDCDDAAAACWTEAHCSDGDGDGVRVCDGDCADADPLRYAGAAEGCDGFDTDCDGEVPASEQDGDGDAYRPCEGDCDDDRQDAWPDAPELCNGLDDDCDGEVPAGEVDADADGFPSCGDCDDGSSDANPGASEVPYDGVDQDCSGADLVDVDGDGAVAEEAGGDDCDDDDPLRFPGAADDPQDGVDANCDGWPGVDEDGDEYAYLFEDCDDGDETINPGAVELCDGIDQDCDGVPSSLNMGDEVDSDGDGFLACEECDDEAAAVYPGAAEDDCDGADTDCDGSLAPGDLDADGDGDLACTDCDDTDASLNTLDLDGDTWDRCVDPAIPGDALDCDDLQSSWNPSVTDIAGDDFDQNCDGTDGLDADGDGWASIPSGGEDCDDDDPGLNLDDADADGLTSCDGDCDDFDPLNFAGNAEVCDLQDNDCDGTLDEDGVDADGDGQGCWDCDDADPSVHAGAPEGCDLLDTDCDGSLPAEEADEDGDGVATCVGDCDDADAANYPGNLEACDVQDNDCDGEVDEGTDIDGDGDGWYECQGDCDDTDVENFPFSPELCDGQDNDCDGVIPLADQDSDGDGYMPCEGDCDDGEAWSNPGATEIFDGLDNDCDGTVDSGVVTCTATVPLDQPTIQAAINAAGAGDVLCVEPGTYAENLVISGRTLELRGLAGPGMTTVQQGSAAHVLAIWDGPAPGVLIKGFGIVDGATGDNTLNVDSYAPVTIEDVRVLVPGVITRFWRAPITMSRVLFVDSGVHFDGGADATVSDLVLDGGGLAVLGGSSLVCQRCRVRGAINAGVSCATSSLTLLDSFVTENGGVGVSAPVGGYPCSLVELGRTLVAANDGEGIQTGVPTVIDHSAILGNGGIGVYASGTNLDLAVSNSIIGLNPEPGPLGYGNPADGIWVWSYTPLPTSITNTVFWEDDASVEPGLQPVLGVDGNLSADPLFLGDLSHPNPLRWDLHLDPSSPLVDAGSGLDPDGSPADIGIYGGPDAAGFDLDGDGYPEWWQPGPYDSVTYPALGWDCDDGDASTFPGQGC